MRRRTFLGLSSTLALRPALSFAARPSSEVYSFEKGRVVKQAQRYLGEAPVTITASTNPRSAGGPHDFSSEADYWWPDPKNPKGPYVQRDGMSNPDNFIEHRKAMLRLSVQVGALAAAWRLSGERKFAQHA